MNRNKLILVEDDPSLGYLLKEYLVLKGFKVDLAVSGMDAIKMVRHNFYDLAILDIMMPGMDGFELASKLKSNFEYLPFIFLSAKSMRIDKLKGYNIGAFDYITKPVDEEILVAKINAIIELTSSKKGLETKTYNIGEYIYTPEINELKFNKEFFNLSNKENELLLLLCSNKNALLLRDVALNKIWGEKSEFTRKSMDVFISRLRKYFKNDKSITIKNIHGKGFILSD